MPADPSQPSTASQRYVDYDEYVDFQIEKARSHIKATDIFTTLTTLAAAFVGYLFLFVLFDQWVIEGGFSDWARIALLTIVLAGIGGTLLRSVVLPLARRVHPLYAARVIEKADPNLKSNLLNFVDLRQSDGTETSPGVMRAMQKRAAVELSHIDIDETIDRRPLLRMAYALLGIVILSALYIVFSPKDPFTSVRRALLPAASIAVATQTTITDVTPGDDHVPARSHLTVEADVRGRDFDHVQILVTTSDHKEVDQPVEMRRVDPDLPRFRGVLNGENGRGLLQSLSYAITAGDARTRDFHIEVIQPPSARVDEVHCSFPSYMQFEERTTPGGNIDGWEGATVTVRATANMPVKSATLVMIDNEDPHAKGEQMAMQVVDGTKLSASWKLEFRSDGSVPHFYYLQVKTAKGESDPEPTVHPLRIRPDQRPEVALLSPAGDLVGDRARAANAIIPLVIQAADPDFLLRSIRLRAERNGEELVSEPLFEERDLGQAFRGSYDWNLATLRSKLRPGETIQFWIEARDNKQPTANRSVTPRVNLEIRPEKSADEVRKDLVAEKRDQADQIAQADETKNAGGNERVERKDTQDASDQPPPAERPGDNSPDAPRQPTDRPRDENRSDESQRGDKPESGSAKPDEGNPSQPQPPGNDPRTALEKLLQKETEEDEPPENKPPEDPQPAEKSESGDQAKGAGQKKNGAKKGAEKSAAGNDPTTAPPRQEPGTEHRKKGAGEPTPDPKSEPGTDPAKKPGDRSKPGSKPDASDTENPNSSDPENRKEPPKPDSPSSAPNERKPADKQEDKKQPGGKEGAEKTPDRNNTDRNNTDRNNTDKKNTDEKKTPDESSGKKEEDAADHRDSNPDKTDKEKSGAREPSKDERGDRPDTEKKKPQKSNETESDGGQSGDDTAPQEGDGGRGQPSKKKSKTEEEKPGEANEPDSDPNSKAPRRGKKSESTDPNGPSEPADESPDATKQKATGNESGEGTGSDEEDPDAPRKNDLERKPDSKPGRMKSSDSENGGAKQPGERRPPDEGGSSRTDDAKETRRAPDGKKPTEQPGPTDDPAAEKSNVKRPTDPEKRPGQPPEAGNPKLKGEGRKPGQKSEQPEGGENGESTASDEGKPGGNKEGAGDKSDQPGDSEPSKEKTGKAGNKKGEGSSTKSSDGGGKSKGEKGGKKGEAGDGKGEGEGEGEPSDSEGAGSKPGTKPSSKPGSKPGSGGEPSSQPGSPSSSPVGGGATDRANGNAPQVGDGNTDGDASSASGTAGDGVPTPEEEQARLEYARKASNLLLKRLKDQLSRGEVDEKLLDEMGWKDIDDVVKFTRYLEDNLKNTTDDAKRMQFEELLKNMRLGKETVRRTGGSGPERRVDNAARLVPVPPEYRQQYENYTKRLGRAKPEGDVKANKSAPAKK